MFAAIFFLFVVGLIFLSLQVLSNIPPIICFITCFLFALFIIYSIYDGIRKDAKKIQMQQEIEKKQAEHRNSILQKSLEIIEEYSIELGRERFRQSYIDAYGIRRYDKWEMKGRVYFLTQVLIPKHPYGSEINNISLVKTIIEFIDKVASENESPNTNVTINTSINSSMSGEEYEQYCAKLLSSVGWKVSMTPRTGDHGVDLIAEKNNIRICLQCKHWSTKVNNKAVQEVSSGRIHYQGTHAGVISNNSFTKQAIEIAESNQVLLIHHAELEMLEEIIKKRDSSFLIVELPTLPSKPTTLPELPAVTEATDTTNITPTFTASSVLDQFFDDTYAIVESPTLPSKTATLPELPSKNEATDTT